jgi:hypothetical protein
VSDEQALIQGNRCPGFLDDHPLHRSAGGGNLPFYPVDIDPLTAQTYQQDTGQVRVLAKGDKRTGGDFKVRL